jgi:aryl-alcohol dehydrogenase-like predicted oxidoreductase
MRYRRLGRTGYSVSEIGFGAWGIGGSMWIGARDDESLKALHRAVDLGVSFIDTAYAYGHGHSEELIGRFLRERSERVYVATKIPPSNTIWPAPPDSALNEVFPSKHIISCTETSLKRLGVECIDLQQFHAWNDGWADQDEWKRAVEKLKTEGKIRFMGISMNDNQPENGIAAAETGLIDSFQVIYNIFEQAPERKLFPYCQEKNLGVIVRVPLDEGGLTGNITPETTFPETDWRNHYFSGARKKEVFEHVGRLRFLLHDGISSMTEAALRFCLSHPAVSSVIVGMRTVRHVEENCRVSDGRVLPKDDLLALHSHAWPRNYYAN